MTLRENAQFIDELRQHYRRLDGLLEEHKDKLGDAIWLFNEPVIGMRTLLFQSILDPNKHMAADAASPAPAKCPDPEACPRGGDHPGRLCPRLHLPGCPSILCVSDQAYGPCTCTTVAGLAPDECPACHVYGLSMGRRSGACHALDCHDPLAWLRGAAAPPVRPATDASKTPSNPPSPEEIEDRKLGAPHGASPVKLKVVR